jgi:hypothetical protein
MTSSGVGVMFNSCGRSLVLGFGEIALNIKMTAVRSGILENLQLGKNWPKGLFSLVMKKNQLSLVLGFLGCYTGWRLERDTREPLLREI